MFFFSSCIINASFNPFSVLGNVELLYLLYFLDDDDCALLAKGVGSVRTATKRAGGTVHNHGGSPGKRLGVKKFSGTFFPHAEYDVC
jgi:hypothetical protein